MTPLTVAYLLIVLGLAMLAAELFIPSGGTLFIASSLCILGGVVLTFIYGDTSTGMVTLLGVFVAGPAVGALMLYLWPRTPMARRMMLPGQDDAAAALPAAGEL